MRAQHILPKIGSTVINSSIQILYHNNTIALKAENDTLFSIKNSQQDRNVSTGYKVQIVLYSTLLYATLRYSTLHYATLRYATLLYATLQSTLLYATLLYATLLIGN
jgi:uncharacterized protein YjbI with pentapeptide repeats